MKIYQSFSATQTRKIGASLAKKILNFPLSKNAVVVTLKGDLGSGKTTFAQGFLTGLGIKKKATSPTFVLLRRFALNNKKFADFYHIDCYRINNITETSFLGIEKIVKNPKNIVLVEWPEKIDRILPAKRIKVHFRYGEKQNEREIRVLRNW